MNELLRGLTWGFAIELGGVAFLAIVWWFLNLVLP